MHYSLNMSHFDTKNNTIVPFFTHLHWLNVTWMLLPCCCFNFGFSKHKPAQWGLLQETGLQSKNPERNTNTPNSCGWKWMMWCPYCSSKGGICSNKLEASRGKQKQRIVHFHVRMIFGPQHLSLPLNQQTQLTISLF